MELGQRRTTCGRGVLALKSRKPLRKPGTSKTTQNECPAPPRISENGEKILLAKYSYKSNPGQPGGFPELTVKQGEKVIFMNVHPDQKLWWCVKQKDSGNTGYVPASYMMVLSEKPTSLPWLENKKLLEKQAEPVEPETIVFGALPFKPYVSAYDKSGNLMNNLGGISQEKKYYCAVCETHLNGPKPYQAHMVSKDHREELQAQSYNS